jgi:DNA-binding GntR family transcriptional regulator
MAAMVAYSPHAMDAIAVELFDLLWGGTPLPTAVDHAFGVIWRQLITGEHKPGERLSDVELAAQLGVSRTPVRQALHRLAHYELVRFDPRRGFSVREFTAQDVHEMYDIRSALEVLALRQAAPHLKPADLQEQLDFIANLRPRLNEEPAIALFLQSDFQFHNLIIHASDNRRLIRMLAELRSQVSIFQIRDAGYPRRNEIALEGHERLLLALLEGEIETATRLLADHIATSKAGVLADIFGEGGEVLPGALDHVAAPSEREVVRANKRHASHLRLSDLG